MVIYCCHRKEPDSTGAGNAIVCVGGLLEGRGGLSIKENSSSRVWGDGGASSGKLQAQICVVADGNLHFRQAVAIVLPLAVNLVHLAAVLH